MRCSFFAMLPLVLLACSDEPPESAPPLHASRLRVRLGIADETAPKMTVYDIGDSEIVADLTLPAPATKVEGSYTGDTAIVSFADASLSIVAGGVAVIPHKDHIHIFKSPPSVVGTPLAGAGAPAVVYGDAKWGINYAGDASKSPETFALSERGWVQGNPTKAPVGGSGGILGASLVVPFAGKFLVGRAGESTTTVIEEYADAAAEPRRLFDCPDLSGVTSTGQVTAFACSTGIVLIGEDGDPTPPLAYPSPGKFALTSLHNQPIGLARDASTGALASVDFVARQMRPISTSARACTAVLAIDDASQAVVLTEAGRVERYDLTTGMRISQSDVVGLASCDGAEGSLAAGPDSEWLTSPSTGKVLELDAQSGKVRRQISVGGAPRSIVVFGLDARNADLSAGSDSLSD